MCVYVCVCAWDLEVIVDNKLLVLLRLHSSKRFQPLPPQTSNSIYQEFQCNMDNSHTQFRWLILILSK